ncbi:MAG: cytochrome b N-terminal domain-containing protein [Nitrospirota bacterium]|nr:cytochrome b N-terminal domain-containing protein [Nitrospirota bacterium]
MGRWFGKLWPFKRERNPDSGEGLRNVLNIASLFTGVLYGELDERLDFRAALSKALRKPVPAHVNFWFCFGGIAFLIFLIQVVTGVALLLYYRPTVDQAYASVVHITNVVPFGWLTRGFHHWGANLIMVVVMIHALRVFMYGAYKPPRDFNWVVGSLLMFGLLIFGFSGYLLPWNSLSYWATVVGAEIPGAIPLIGDDLVYFIKGGDTVGQLALTRFFAFHVVLMPLAMMVLLLMHFLMIRRLGISGPL